MIYLAGCITNRNRKKQLRNIARFHSKARELRGLGLDVYNPVEYEPEGKTWEWYMAHDINWIYENKPDTFYFMKGWHKSKGARLEHEVAIKLKAKIIYES